MRRWNPLVVYSPPNTIELFDGFNPVYEDYIADRFTRRSLENMDTNLAYGLPRIITATDNEAVIAYEDNGLINKAFRVEHPEC